MLKHIFFASVVVSTLAAAASCKVSRERQSLAFEAKDSLIYGAWTHSHEEDQNDMRVYRRAGYKFPPSRGREGMEFLSNGKLLYNAIGPTDAPQNLPGTWGFSSKQTLHLTLESGRQFSYTLAKIEKDRMVGRWEEQ